MKRLSSWAAASAALAIVAGAFAAHAGASAQSADWLKTGTSYLLPHAVACWFLSEKHAPIAGWLLAGALIFSGSLYLMAWGAPRWFGAITPAGGLIMILAWLRLAWLCREPSSKA